MFVRRLSLSRFLSGQRGRGRNCINSNRGVITIPISIKIEMITDNPTSLIIAIPHAECKARSGEYFVKIRRLPMKTTKMPIRRDKNEILIIDVFLEVFFD